jgi:hypothetical protein
MSKLLKVPYILTDAGRYADLMKQGFMKPLRPTRVRKDGSPYGTPKPIVACRGCENWHRQGAHTVTDPAIRRANLAKYQERDRRYAAIRKRGAA